MSLSRILQQNVVRTFAGTIAAAMLLGSSGGCGPEKFTVKFNVADVINVPAGGDDNQGQMLDVDIVVLDKKDNEKHPGIRDGNLRARDWFQLRDRADQKIPRERIYTMCAGEKRAASATRVRDALTGAKRMGTSQVSVDIEYKDVSDPVFAVFGAFRESLQSNDIRNTDPIILKPGWKTKEGTVRVERDRLSRP